MRWFDSLLQFVEHCLATRHSVSMSNFKILSREREWHRRKVKEAILSREREWHRRKVKEAILSREREWHRRKVKEAILSREREWHRRKVKEAILSRERAWHRRKVKEAILSREREWHRRKVKEAIYINNRAPPWIVIRDTSCPPIYNQILLWLSGSSHRPAICDPSHWSGSKCQHSFHNLCFKVTGQQCVIQAIEVGLNVSIRSTICASKSQASNVWSRP